MFKIQKGTRLLKILVMIVLDVISIALSYFAALWVRFEFRFDEIPEHFLNTFLHMIWIWIPLCIIVFILMRTYESLWSYVNLNFLFRIMVAYLILTAAGATAVFTFKINMPRSFYIMGLFFSFSFTVMLRFGHRLIVGLIGYTERTASDAQRIMVIGAGEAGRTLIREIKNTNMLSDKVVCVIDDDPDKIGCSIEGIQIVGNRDRIPDMVNRYKVDKILFSIPTCDAQNRKKILNICTQTGCEVRVIPGVYQLVNGQVSTGVLRKVELQDLLGREPVKVNLDEIFRYISGKVVMVTGGGGSIGSELCRQIAKSHPKQLIIFDIYENNAYDIQMELIRNYPGLNLEVLIGSVRNTARLDYVLGKYHPELVFHAAAHKHVPLMEDSPNEAIKNNVFGTYKMAQASVKYGVKKFVLISTDKAVNPTNIMGASKRLCEMVVQMMGRQQKVTDFVAVRFGNVLGSNGSVIPLFEKQIAGGGPVTVTHPDITRFFMTIPEAVSLVLQAGYYAKGGEIFVLDMGQPVRIADMARNLIRLSGFEPDVDIEIKYTGLRPGEKLYEEILMSEEGLQETANKLIHIGKPIVMDDEKFKEQLRILENAYKVEVTNMKEIVAEMVPTYKPNASDR